MTVNTGLISCVWPSTKWGYQHSPDIKYNPLLCFVMVWYAPFTHILQGYFNSQQTAIKNISILWIKPKKLTNRLKKWITHICWARYCNQNKTKQAKIECTYIIYIMQNRTKSCAYYPRYTVSEDNDLHDLYFGIRNPTFRVADGYCIVSSGLLLESRSVSVCGETWLVMMGRLLRKSRDSILSGYVWLMDMQLWCMHSHIRSFPCTLHQRPFPWILSSINCGLIKHPLM